MALSLTASQKSLRSLFINDDRYIIPTFQRPYSWGKKEIIQLFEDVTDAYYQAKEYFLGNVVIANSSQVDSYPHLIDGQQRIITLWIMIKVLHVLTGNNKLDKMLRIDDEKNMPVSKIKSEVYEGVDQDNINTLLRWDDKNLNVAGRVMSSYKGVLYNAVVCYRLFKEFFSRLVKEEQDSFIFYFINKVYLLPIELDGEDMEDATSRALTIFETINNRGLDLDDSDILKAKLYEMARTLKEHHEFEARWKQFGKMCLEAGNSVNDAFRFYLRIIRAKYFQTTSEPNLRNFFLTDSTSPFRTKMWRDIMEDLNEVGKTLRFINLMKYSSTRNALLFQILDSHTSKLPFSSLVVFLYTYRNLDDIDKEDAAVNFLSDLIKDCYRFNPSNDIKYRIFEINAMIVSKQDWAIMHDIISPDFFEERKRMRSGFVLLYHYLIEQNWEKELMRTEFKVERVVQTKDMPYLDSAEWPERSQSEDLGDMANYSITDFPRSYKTLHDSCSLYNSSSLCSVREILNGNDFYGYSDFIIRKEKMRKVLLDFFLS